MIKYPIPKKANNPITGEVKPKKSKYKNRKVLIDDIWFASAKEGERYRQLKLLQQAGIIKDLQIQVPYVLQESFKIGNKTIREIKYISDFVYMQKCKTSDIELWEQVIEDCKGMRTDVYKIKAKMFAYKYGYEISEV